MENRRIGIRIFELKWFISGYAGETYNSWKKQHTSNIFSQTMTSYLQKNERLLKYGK